MDEFFSAGHKKLTSGHGATSPPQSANDVAHCQKFIQLHVITKKICTKRDPSCFDNFLAGIDTCDLDVLCICDTWRGDDFEL